ncbi:MAG: type IV pilus secretin PilQ [Betaproteobacteria bacterium]|nr:type IV pilus secretin PilQ [Betaproteobacteria bacterium]
MLGGVPLHAQSPGPAAPAAALNAVEKVQVNRQGTNVIVKVVMSQPLAAPPATFSIANPPRISLDFPNTANGLGVNSQPINEGDVRSASVVQVGERTRLVLNLARMPAYEMRTEGRAVLLTLTPQAPAPAGAPLAARFAEVRAADVPHSIRNVTFRRGKDGEGRVIVDLSDSTTGIDIRQEGTSLVVDFVKTALPAELRKRLDVNDFATPVTNVNTFTQGDNVRMVISPRGLWEHNAYQSDNQFVVEVKPVIENPNKLVQGSRGGFRGEKLSLNFQDVDVRAVLQVIADFTNFNIITSDTVAGKLTLRLKDVPWDQALDIILQAKGLDMRKNGNVIWIAPRDELTAKEKLDLESRQQITDLEPTRTESFQLNYQRAEAVQKLITDKAQPMLSKRGSAVVDARTNKLFVQDAPSRLEDVRRLIAEIDVPVRQVLIEARIVEAEDTFGRNLGVRWGLHDLGAGRRIPGNSGSFRVGGGLADTGFHTGQVSTDPNFITDAMSVNLPAGNIGGNRPGQFSFVLFNRAATQFLNLEISALEADGKGKVVSSPRVMTADQVEALIEQGTELPYESASSSGATTVSFRKASLALKVKPQITPDGRIMMQLDVNKDTPNTRIPTRSGVAIDTKHVKTEVLVENGGTVVIGGIYTQDQATTVNRVPFFGSLPYVGALFRNTERRDNKSELLVFITPKIVSEALTLR